MTTYDPSLSANVMVSAIFENIAPPAYILLSEPALARERTAAQERYQKRFDNTSRGYENPFRNHNVPNNLEIECESTKPPI
jgi:hypothetical protein